MHGRTALIGTCFLGGWVKRIFFFFFYFLGGVCERGIPLPETMGCVDRAKAALEVRKLGE